MELISVTRKTDDIYEIVFVKGRFFKKTHTEEVHHSVFSWHILRNGNEIGYNIGKALDTISHSMLVGETYTLGK